MIEYCLYPLIDSKLLNAISLELEKVKWEPGATTNEKAVARKSKNNFEALNSKYKSNIIKIIENKLRSSHTYSRFVIPNWIKGTSSLLNKYTARGFYNLHSDFYALGDYSTTIFLSSPDDYEAGELCLVNTYTQEHIKIKPPAGYAVTYATGTQHYVNEVTSGERVCVVNWVHSKCTDQNIRRTLEALFLADTELSDNNIIQAKEQISIALNELQRRITER